MTNTLDTPPDRNTPVTYYPLRIIQIAVSNDGLYALADNGTVWHWVTLGEPDGSTIRYRSTWKSLPSLPRTVP